VTNDKIDPYAVEVGKAAQGVCDANPDAAAKLHACEIASQLSANPDAWAAGDGKLYALIGEANVHIGDYLH
jgi:hypothetical protein